ncbi:MAG TPA: MmgE/PrpD family protein [Aestuariivirgaceae bacterium]|nr:MmgE/PrpD family protein [Aestuariivirgaceae bacterium]
MGASHVASQRATSDGRAALQRLAADALDYHGPAPASPEHAKAVTCLLDFFSCAFEAMEQPWTRQAVAVCARLDAGSTVIGRDFRTTAEDAAFANAVAGHGLVREDMHAGSISHLGVVVWPTLLALAETRAMSGRDLLRGAVVGYEVGGRLGRQLVTPEVARLFRPTGLVGPLAAAAAGAVAIHLDCITTASAMALAANCSAGLNEWAANGADEMYFHPGFAARNAIRSLALAEHGAWGSPSVLEGSAGLFAGFARTPLQGAIELFPGARAEVLAVFNKPVPACNFAQSPCQAALAAIARAGCDSRRIRSVDVHASTAAITYPGCDARGPFTRPLQAKMSIAFGVAAAIARGGGEEGNYALLDDAEITRLIGATSLIVDPDIDVAFPQRQAARVTLELDDGSRLSAAYDDVVAATPEFVRERFRAAADAAVGQGARERLEDLVTGLADLDDCAALSRAAAGKQQ